MQIWLSAPNYLDQGDFTHEIIIYLVSQVKPKLDFVKGESDLSFEYRPYTAAC